MRLHDFTNSRGVVWINLDQVAAVRDMGTHREITIGSWTHVVDAPLDGLLALISPPAAPDTYEEDLRKEQYTPSHDAGLRNLVEKLPFTRAAKAFANNPTSENLDKLFENAIARAMTSNELVREAQRQARLDEIQRFYNYVTAGRRSWESLFEHIARRRIELEA